jgi:Ca2+-binding RTX toxin-like protein
MSEQGAIETYGDELFGQGTQAALDALGKAYELAFMKQLSQLSSPTATIVDRTGHIGVAREIASYKTSLALAETLAVQVQAQSDPRVQAILKQLSGEFSEFAASAGSRIVSASAFADATTTVERAIAEIFQTSDEFVQELLAPTPGADWSVHEIVGAIEQALAAGESTALIVKRIQEMGVDVAAQSMTTLSLGLEAHVKETGSDGWGAIAAQAGGAALLLDALFNAGYAPGLQVNTDQPFYLDAGLADRVRALLESKAADFTVVGDYLPDVQALAWLVSSIDVGFSTDDLNQMVAAASAAGDQAGVLQLVESLTRIVSGRDTTVPSTSAGFYRSIFATIDAVQTTYPSGLDLQSLVDAKAGAISTAASQAGAAGTAYRYALSELNVFVLVGADYSSFNADGELDLYDEATGHGTFSAEYLADRPELLAAMVQSNLADIAPDASGTTVIPGLTHAFADAEAGIYLAGTSAPAGLTLFNGAATGPIAGTVGDDRIYGEDGDDAIDGGAGNDMLDGGAGDDGLFGGEGDDMLLGGAGRDTLRGGQDRDVLRGGAGDDEMIGDGDGDILEGGTGHDTYRVRQGDVILDEDGQGEITFGDAGTAITGGGAVEDSSLFVSENGAVVYRQNDDGSIDFWVDGQRVSVLPGVDDGGPRRRRDDGAPQEDQGSDQDDEAVVSGKPMLGMPLRQSGAPLDPSYKTPFMLAQAAPAPRKDPLVLDLDGDGIETLGQQAVTYFDHDGNGFAELTGWVGGDDGFLVFDRNGDGRISDGREMFGDHTVLANGAVAANGLEALAEWDLANNGGNGDGVIDAGDSVWSSLRVWRDVDADGFSDSGELFALSAVGVGAIDLGFTLTNANDGLGNTQQRAGSFTRSDGTTGTIGEYLLARNATISIAESTVAIGADVAALPEVRGAGNVYDLRQAMARDDGLEKLVAAFVQENDGARRDDLLEQILFRWAGADGVDANDRGGMIDARKLVTLEHFLAESFSGALGEDPVPEAAIQLERAWHDLAEQVNAKLMAQSHLADLYQQITYTFDVGSGQVHADLSAVTEFIDAQLAADFAAGKALLADLGRVLRGMDEFNSADYQALRASYAARSEELAIAFESGGLNFVSEVTGATRRDGTTGADLLAGSAASDSIMGFDGDDVIYGLDGDDVLSGCEDNDILYGGAGNDNLFGGTGDDVLDGGAGNDYLNGGVGSDTYVLSRGMGFDHVRDYDAGANTDIIRVDPDIGPAGIRYWRQGDNLYVGIAGTGDGLVVENWFANAASRVEEVVFGNGMRLTADVLAQARYSGTVGADVMRGDAEANYLEGLAGNDIIYGGAGNDVLDGGAGDDALYGGSSGSAADAGAGNDTYLFGRGYGKDRIYDHDTTAGNTDTIRLVGLNLSDVTLKREGRDFVISVKGTDDVLRVVEWGQGAAYRIERLEFADGTVLEGSALAAPFLGTAGNDTLAGTVGADLLAGLEGNDILFGGAGDDLLDGGAGNDTLYGGVAGQGGTAGAGDDTYLFGRGYGQDTIYDYDTTAGNVDTIKLIDLNQADVTIKREGSAFVISVNGSNDVLRVADWGMGAAARIERVQFADGTVLEGDALVAPFLGTAGSDNIIGRVEADVLMGMAGNDTLSGGAGDDVLDGGAGNDALYGGVSGNFSGAGAGNDTYVFGLGYGQDTIYDFDATPGNVDTIKLTDLNLADVTIKRDASAFYVSVNGTNDVLKVADWGSGAAYRIERIVFADGTVLEGAALAATPFLGTGGADTIKANGDHDVIRGLGGNDLLYGGAGNDLLDGGAGNDTLYGGTSGYGTAAGAGNDTYVFGRGYGQDTVYDYDATPGNIDTIKLLDLNAGDVTIRRDASSFYIEINGTTERIRVADWGQGAASRIERVEFADGSVLEGDALASTPYLGTAGNDTIQGTAAGEIMRGLGGNDMLIGGAGDDLLDGGDGNDTLRGDAGNNVLIGGDGADSLYGGSDNDLLDGGTGADRMYGYAGDDVYWVDHADDKVNESFNQGTDTVIASIDYTLGSSVENLTLVGSADLRGTGSSANNVLRGNAGNNILSGGSGDDALYGDSGNDTLDGGSGNDYLSGDSGDDALDGGSANDYLSGGSGADFLDGGSGTDVLHGGEGNDTLRDTSGNSVVDGGTGADNLYAEGASFLAGGKGDDVIEATGMASVIAQNVGDGNDVVRASSQRVTVSLGGQLDYDDLKLRKDGANLVMETSSGDSTTFEGWYDAGTAQPQYLTLQVMTQAMDGFDAAGSDPLLNQRVQQFNLKALVDAYDADRMANPGLDRWSMMHKLLDARLAAYDSAALGGELAQAYAANGSLAGVALSTAQNTVGAGGFGQQAQALTGVQDPNSIKLS